MSSYCLTSEPVKRTIINGYDIGQRAMPSDAFYTGTNGIRTETVFGGADCKTTIAELEADQKELYKLFKSGGMESAAYQREWQMLEDQIKEIRQEREQAKQQANSQSDDDMGT